VSDFWERPEQVERFASREPDVRLRALLSRWKNPASTRALDLGCAAGRNAVLLAQHGFDVIAVDGSRAMVERTRSRLEPFVPARELPRRVRAARMDDLPGIESASVDLLVALGVYHQAQSGAEWERALAESARVVRPDGLALVSVFTPETDLTGEGIRAIPGEPHVFEGFPGGGRVYLVDAATLDADMARYGFRPETPTETVRRVAGTERRSSVNALYIRGA
jgi:SAM-dependent methyltransferase